MQAVGLRPTIEKSPSAFSSDFDDRKGKNRIGVARNEILLFVAIQDPGVDVLQNWKSVVLSVGMRGQTYLQHIPKKPRPRNLPQPDSYTVLFTWGEKKTFWGAELEPITDNH